MAKSLISNRAVFKDKQEQIKFLLEVKKKLVLSWADMAMLLKLNPRTVRDWSKGKFNMSYDTAVSLAKKSGIFLPKNIKNVSWREHLNSIAVKGGEYNYKKNGNKYFQTDRRLEEWRKWWRTVGREKSAFLYDRKKITIPNRNESLAEFVGIMIGDGGMIEDRIAITLNSESDKEYSEFVCSLIKKLFKLEPKIYQRKNMSALDIVVHSRNLVDFCLSLGLKKGNKLKQNLCMPAWILEKEEFALACLRGLFDTDGSVFIHRYNAKGKTYFYPKLSFTSRSKTLVEEVSKTLKKKQFNARISKNCLDVRIENSEDVARFMALIGSSNKKHFEVLRRGA